MEGTEAEGGNVEAATKRPYQANLQRLPGLKKARDNAALTVRELAALAGVHYVTIHHLERGNSSARPSTVRKLSNALGVRPVDLYTPPEETDGR